MLTTYEKTWFFDHLNRGDVKICGLKFGDN